MTMFEGSVIKDTGNVLCTSCYTLKGDSTFMFTSTNVFKSIDEHYNDGFSRPSLQKTVQYTSITLNEMFTPMMCQQYILQIDVEEKISEVDLMQCKIGTIIVDIGSVTQKTSSRRRVPRRTRVSIGNDRV